ncbi:MAG: membrane protein insertase YidC [Acidimicrobiia bacterium]|nr:membrane protein insertase YidC [Acidimicrobiia bacterium]
MERRVLVAVILSFLVLYGYQALFITPTQPPSGDGATAGGQASATPDKTPAAAIPASPSSAPSPVGPAAGSPVTSESSERDVRIETDRFIATFTNRGARLKSWRLKRYLDDAQQPLELVAHDISADVVLPFTLQLEDVAVTRTLDSALYVASGAPGADAITGPTTLTFEYSDSTGLRALKSFAFLPASYVVTVTATVTAGDRALAPAIVWGPALGDHDSTSGSYSVKPRGVFSSADSVTRLTGSEVGTQPTYSGDFQFAGVDDHYFITTAVKPGPASITYQHVSIPAPTGGSEAARELMSYSLKPQGTGAVDFFVGPKDFDQLAAVDRSLVRAIDFGYFAFVIVPLLRALNWVYGYVGNYGWAIIVLTVLINAAMFPLRHKSVVSMRKMQELQPEAKAIQDHYAKFKSTDPEKQKMNQELMALYRDRGVNPASGCIPMLLTLPVLIAFYNMLTTAIELRGAPFVGWIQDLSLYDRYYVTPILMLLSQVWQTRITPTAGADPAQQKMMMFMPVIMMFFFLWAPAGVAIYWFVSNLWGIGQQYLTNYLIGPPNVRPPRHAAERRVKRVGGGKTEGAARES